MKSKRPKLLAALLALTTLTATYAVPVTPAPGGDMEIAHIAYTAGQIDIRYAHLALAISEDERVREFAQTMIRDHSAINEAAIALLTELGATPVENDTSRRLMQQASAKRDELSTLRGVAFDNAYMQNELAYHRFVNETVETTFIPAVENERFRDLLKSALRTFKAHEGHAARLAG